jgi:spermidine/putrescine transport system permease protein
VERHLRASDGSLTGHRRRWGKALAPYLLTMPGGLWLLLFFIAPLVIMTSLSLQTGDLLSGFSMSWRFSTYPEVISQYKPQIIRSLSYSAIATVIGLLVSYPLAYWIAFHVRRHKTTFLLILILPFFVSFVIRTLAWQFILSDEGIVLGTLKRLNLLPESFHVLATSAAVISGLAYNFLPFMALPLYVALEKIDRRTVEAASDLYASRAQVFLRVILPLSMPGVFAGSLLTFVPAAGDYVNAALLGGTKNSMMGNVIQREYLEYLHYPAAAALSFILMALLLIGIFVYARALGSRAIEEYV